MLQTLVILAAVVCAVVGPRWPDGAAPWLRIAGFLLEAVGVAIFVASRVALGPSFTPLPRPRDRATLRTTGIYARVRHPVYSALIAAGALTYRLLRSQPE